MTPFDVIAFDADDTLWENEYLYRQAKDGFLDLFARCKERDDCLQRLEELDISNVRYYGYGIKSFILSMVEAALELSDAAETGENIAAILKMARQMLSAEVRLIDGVGDVLEVLAQCCPLMLITKGDPSEQRPKILRSGLADYFRWIEIVDEKNPAIYRTILERYGITAPRFLMVGNSLLSDVLPVVEIGGRAVYVPHANTWAYEMAADEPAGEFTTLDNLRLLPGFVEELARDGGSEG